MTAGRWKPTVPVLGREAEGTPPFNAGFGALRDACCDGGCCRRSGTSASRALRRTRLFGTNPLLSWMRRRTSCDPVCINLHPRQCCASNPPTGILAESCPDKQVHAWCLGPGLGPSSAVFTPLALQSPLGPGLLQGGMTVGQGGPCPLEVP